MSENKLNIKSFDSPMATPWANVEYKVMKKHINLWLIGLCVIGFSTQMQGQKLAITDESTVYINVYKGNGTNYEIITRIGKDDFFYCDSVLNDEWVKITALEWTRNGEQVEGFVLKNSILLVENFGIEKQKELIIQVLSTQKQLSDDFNECYNVIDSGKKLEELNIRRKKMENYAELKYDPILDFLPTYFCQTKDTDILQLFYITMLANSGSANESPSFTIGKCYACEPDLVLNQIQYLESTEGKEFIFNKIEWGLENNFYNKYNVEYTNLKTRLENERKNNR